ncbi:MAG: terminase [Firmicutes bacterium]|nr:terminase [Bacillota bacterium]
MDELSKNERAWRATPRQEEFLNSPEDEVLYGGAAGGGKSDALLIFSILRRQSIEGSRGLILRRTYPELERSLILRSYEMLTGWASYQAQKHRWQFPNGSLLEFGYCERDEDVFRYQSAEYDDLCFDELTQFSEYQYTYLMSRCRTTKPGVRTLVRAATNPGGVGHGWVKSRFIDVCRWGESYSDPRTGRTRRFLPARLSDNPYLGEEYQRTLEELPEAERRALKDGDWDVYAGQYFREFAREKGGRPWHVTEPGEVALSPYWRRFRSMDWGYNDPCCVLWHCVDGEGRVYTYRELYVREMRASDTARLIQRLSEGEEIDYTAASPDMWARRGNDGLQGESLADTFAANGVYLVKADADRVNGWSRMREFLAEAPDGLPWWRIFSTCANLIRTLPTLVYDRHRVEDAAGGTEDHAPEAARYGLMSRPRPRPAERPGRKPGFPFWGEEEREVFLEW